MNVLQGSCHCGQIRIKFQTPTPLSELEVRACQCSFCRRHGSQNVADPHGRVEITAPAESALVRYAFNLRTCDMVLCAKCGQYVAAVLDARGRKFCSLNVQGLGLRELLTSPTVTVSFEGETAEQRLNRRLTKWTPTLIRVASS